MPILEAQRSLKRGLEEFERFLRFFETAFGVPLRNVKVDFNFFSNCNFLKTVFVFQFFFFLSRDQRT